MGITAYVLFFLAGIGFGYAAPTRWKWLPVLFPLALAIGAVLMHGLDGAVVVRLIVALVVWPKRLVAPAGMAATVIAARANAE